MSRHLRGLLDEMVHEAWQATLSFWANKRWRKFVYSHLALLGVIFWHHLAKLIFGGSVHGVNGKSVAVLACDASCSFQLR